MRPPPERDTDGALSWAVHGLAVSMAAVDTVVARSVGLTPTDYLAVKHLLGSEVPLGPGDLSRLLGMSTGSATALADRLERTGHLERQPHPDDRRRLVLVPSAQTVDAVTAALGPLAERIDRVARDLGPAEQRVVERFLGAVAAACVDFRRASGR